MNVQTPHSRNSDPITSHLSGEEIARSGARASQQSRVFFMVATEEGSTSAELADSFDELRHMVARRLPELEGVYLKKGERRTCSISGRKAVTWWLK